MPLVDAFLLDPAPFEIWVAARTDGIGGSGTAADPYNGSTQERFDEVMNKFSVQSNVTIRLGPGTFHTKGYVDGDTSCWQARPSMKIRGSGVDVTTLKLAPLSLANDKHYFAVGHALTSAVDGFEISDLTIDANASVLSATSAYGGVRAMGSHVRIKRVKVKNWGTKSPNVMGYVLSVITFNSNVGGAEFVASGIEECIVVEPLPTNSNRLTALNVGSQLDIVSSREGHGLSPYIRNCFVDCGLMTNHQPDTGKFRAISMSWCRGGVVEGNHVHNADIGGPFLEQRSVRDVIVRNNFYKNVARAVYLSLGQVGSQVSSNTNLTATNGINGTISGGALDLTSVSAGDRVLIIPNPATPPPPAFDGLYQIATLQTSPTAQFTVRTSLKGSAAISAWKVFSAGRVVIEGNTAELAAVSGAVAFSVFDNNDSALNPEPPDYAHGDVLIRNNKIRYVDGVPPVDADTTSNTTTLISVKGALNLTVKDNVLDTLAGAPLINQRCGNATYFNNKKPAGMLIQGKNVATGSKYEELETDNEFALVMSMFLGRRSH